MWHEQEERFKACTKQIQEDYESRIHRLQVSSVCCVSFKLFDFIFSHIPSIENLMRWCQKVTFRTYDWPNAVAFT